MPDDDRTIALAYLSLLSAESLAAVVEAVHQAEFVGNGWLVRQQDGTLRPGDALSIVLEAATPPSFAEVLERTHTAIPWREPIGISTPTAGRYACRICIAAHGIKAAEVATSPYTFPTPAEHASHVEAVHPRSAP